MYLVGPAVASFSLCLAAMLALRPLAIALNLIDRPGGHKTHVGEVPIVGGLAMLLGMTLGLGLITVPGVPAAALLAGGSILVTVGLIDDRFDLSPWTRLPAQVAVAILLMLATGSVVNTIGAPFGGVEIWLDGWVAHGFTILSIIAAINAFNMLDGMDGLAGAMALVAFAALAILMQGTGLTIFLAISFVFIGAVLAFLLVNVPMSFNRHMLCFMGDSGSTLLGFAVVWLCIVVSQSPANAANPVTMLWIVAIPLYEMVWTVIRRGSRGISPFRSDRSHLHHTLRRAGFGFRGAFAVLVSLAAALAAIGILLDELGISDRWSFALLIVAGAGVVRLIYRADILWVFAPVSVRSKRVEP